MGNIAMRSTLWRSIALILYASCAFAQTPTMLEDGGTEADLSSTGGAGQYVKQSLAGAPLSVGTILLGDLPAGIDAISLRSKLVEIGAPIDQEILRWDFNANQLVYSDPFIDKAGDTMTGALNLANGLSTAPSLTFAADTDTGVYRVTENILGIVGGASLLASFEKNLTLGNLANFPASTKVIVDGSINGGTTAAADLDLRSTTNATKGKILFGGSSAYNEVNQRLGIGTLTPSVALDVVGAITSTGLLTATDATLSDTKPILTLIDTNAAVGDDTLVLTFNAANVWEFSADSFNLGITVDADGTPETFIFSPSAFSPAAGDSMDLGTTSSRFTTVYGGVLDITGDIVVAGTVDGRDVANDLIVRDGSIQMTSQLQTSSTSPGVIWFETDGNLDENWQMDVASGELRFMTVHDDITGQSSKLTLTQAGNATVAGDWNFSDGVGDSPKLSFTPQAGPAYSMWVEDTTDDLQIAMTNVVNGTIDITNLDAIGQIDIQLDGDYWARGINPVLHFDRTPPVATSGTLLGAIRFKSAGVTRAAINAVTRDGLGHNSKMIFQIDDGLSFPTPNLQTVLELTELQDVHVNPSQLPDVDFRVDGDVNTSLFFIDSSAEDVIFGASSGARGFITINPPANKQQLTVQGVNGQTSNIFAVEQFDNTPLLTVANNGQLDLHPSSTGISGWNVHHPTSVNSSIRTFMDTTDVQLWSSAEAAANTWAHLFNVKGDANPRFYIYHDGDLRWGPPTTGSDTRLYRSGVGILTTDTAFNVGGNLSITGATTASSGMIVNPGDGQNAITIGPNVAGESYILWQGAGAVYPACRTVGPDDWCLIHRAVGEIQNRFQLTRNGRLSWDDGTETSMDTSLEGLSTGAVQVQYNDVSTNNIQVALNVLRGATKHCSIATSTQCDLDSDCPGAETCVAGVGSNNIGSQISLTTIDDAGGGRLAGSVVGLLFDTATAAPKGQLQLRSRDGKEVITITDGGSTAISKDDATTNTVLNVLTLSRTTSGVGAAGIGGQLTFQTENSAGVTGLAGNIIGKYTNATSGSEAGALELRSKDGTLLSVADGGAIQATAASVSLVLDDSNVAVTDDLFTISSLSSVWTMATDSALADIVVDADGTPASYRFSTTGIVPNSPLSLGSSLGPWGNVITIDLISSGIIKSADGTFSTPSYTFTNDTSLDTGIYRKGENSIGFASGGVLAGFIQSDANWNFNGKQILNASTISSTGVINAAGNVNASPGKFVSTKDQPGLILVETDTVDTNWWIDVEGGVLRFLTVNDALNSWFTAIQVLQTGLVKLSSTGSEVLSLNNTLSTGNPFLSFKQTGIRRSFIQHNDAGDNLTLASEFGGIKLLTGINNAEIKRVEISSTGAISFDNMADGGVALNPTAGSAPDECVWFDSNDIQCGATNGCTQATREESIPDTSHATASFSTSASQHGTITFLTPLNIGGTISTIEIYWISNSGFCNNGVTSDVCFVANAGGISDGGSLNTALGTLATATKKCTAPDDLMISTLGNIVHGCTAGQACRIRIERDTAGTQCGAAGDDDLSGSALMLGVKWCYPVNNVFSGE